MAAIFVALLDSSDAGAYVSGQEVATTLPGISETMALYDEEPVRSSTENLVHQFAAYVDVLAQEDRFSGVVLVAKDGVPRLVKAYGLADRSTGVPNRKDTKFNLGSASKMFTGVAVLQLAQEGKLSLSDPAGAYVPGLPARIAEKVTIEQLLTHTSGLGDFMTPEYHAVRDRIRTVSELLPFAVRQPLRFEPGSAHLYSNAGYVLLGAVIESVSGKPYDDYIRERVTQPAGMENTGLFEKDAATPNLARGYLPEGAPADLRLLPPLDGPSNAPPGGPSDGPRRLEPPTGGPQLLPLPGPVPSGGWQDNYDTLPAKGNPSGGAYATAEDMLKFFQALAEGKLLSPEYAALATTGKVATPKGPTATGSRTSASAALGPWATPAGHPA